jgi:acetyl-CoA C-acetyltransferase
MGLSRAPRTATAIPGAFSLESDSGFPVAANILRVMTSRVPPAGPRAPVIIGVGQFVDRDRGGREPVELMVDALREAEQDTGVHGVLSGVDTVAVVPTFSWRYRDPGRLVGERIGADQPDTWYANVGGNTPQMMLNRLALAIQGGKADLVALTGGESVRSRRLAKASGGDAEWPRQADDVAPTWFDDSPFLMGHPAEAARGIILPTQAYPLFENALWHRSGRTLDEHLGFVGELWAGFSRVAAKNPYAWRQEWFTGPQITTPSPDNRMVGFPYTKRMVSNPQVDMSTGLVMCSFERAREMGVAADRMVFVRAGTDGVDRTLSERTDYVSSPAIRIAGGRALELAGISVADLAHVDIYSCFPSAVQVATAELGIPVDRPLTVYGGLSFAGGPWNNPVGHAIASMVGVLREDPGSLGLVTANGGNIDKHSFGLYSTTPPPDGFRWEKPQERIAAAATPVPVDADHRGPAQIETWTVMHDREGVPERAHAACRTGAGHRTWGVTDDPGVMSEMESRDMVGVSVDIGDEGRLVLR